MSNIRIPRKDTIGEAAESMRQPWENLRLELSSKSIYPLPRSELDKLAVQFVANMMPGERAWVIMDVAKRLISG